MRNPKPATHARVVSPIAATSLPLSCTQAVVVGLAVVVVVATVGRAAPALARSGTHGPTVSTYDPRASSIAVTFRHFTHKTGSLDHVMYTSAFSSTSGRLISQFGVGFVYRSAEGQPTGYGASASAVTMLILPVGERGITGLPVVSVALYGGPAPTFIGGSLFGSFTVPFVLGLGVPLTPASWLTFTPFVEFTPSVDFDAHARNDFKITDENRNKSVEELVDEAVTWDVDYQFGWRAGAMCSFHLGASAEISILVGAANDTRVDQAQWSIGTVLLWHWDDVVAGVRPRVKPSPCAERRCPPTSE